MFYYARSDTHYLLYIYDMLRNELAELPSQNHPDGKPIDRVLQKSREESLQRYEAPLCDPETGAGSRGWYNILVKSPTLYNGEQFAVFKAVYKWRDDLARREDESPHFFMPQPILSDIARIMPTDKKALWSLLDIHGRKLRGYVDELFDLIQEARAKGANGPTMLEFFRTFSGAAAGTPARGGKPETAGPEVDSGPLSIEELKTEHSQLWGSMTLSSAWDGSATTVALDELVEIPLFYVDLTRNALEFGSSDAVEAQEIPGGSAPSEPAAAAEQDEEKDREFTLKRSSRKRKARDVESEPEPEAEPAAGSSSDVEMEEKTSAPASPEDPKAAKEAKKQAKKARKEERKNKKAAAAEKKSEERKQARKERKAAKKAGLEQQAQQHPPPEASSGDDGEEQPFDYTKAESVLRAPKAATNGNGDAAKAGGKAAFDPYAKKSGDAPQGARKMNYEKAGRTATFKK